MVKHLSKMMMDRLQQLQLLTKMVFAQEWLSDMEARDMEEVDIDMEDPQAKLNVLLGIQDREMMMDLLQLLQ